MASLEDIEKQIAELEQEVGSSDDEEDLEVQSLSDKDYQTKKKISESEDDDDSDEELLPIPSLPSHLVPPPGLLLSQTKKGAEGAGSSASKSLKALKPVECSACCETLQGEDAYRKHQKTLKHRQNVVLKAGAAYEPANHEANFCRACNLKFESVTQLLAHRKTSEHKDAMALLARASYCQLCKKQFTSPVQLRGHVIGRAHNDAVERKTGYRPVPLGEGDNFLKPNVRAGTRDKVSQKELRLEAQDASSNRTQSLINQHTSNVKRSKQDFR